MDARKFLPQTWPRPRLPKLFKRMSAPYRMVFIDEQSLEEVASFRLNKHTVYALFTSIALLTAIATVLVIVYSPVKYYLPGYGSSATRTQAFQLQAEVDSMARLVAATERRADRLVGIIAGTDTVRRDTALLPASQLAPTVPDGTLPQADEVKAAALKPVGRQR